MAALRSLPVETDPSGLSILTSGMPTRASVRPATLYGEATKFGYTAHYYLRLVPWAVEEFDPGKDRDSRLDHDGGLER
jgi:hypothetical protein